VPFIALGAWHLSVLFRCLAPIGPHEKTIADEPQTKSILDLAQEHGIDMTKVRDSNDLLDVLTGKRSHEE